MSYIEARNGPLALYNDTFYAKLGVNVSGIRTVGNATIVGSASADFSEGVIETGAAYQIAKWSSGTGGSLKDGYTFDRYTAIDLLAGARYWQQDLNFNLAVTGTLDTDGLVVSGSRAFARCGAVDWVHPLVGFRIRQSLFRRPTMRPASRRPKWYASVGPSGSFYHTTLRASCPHITGWQVQ
jgi:hypothetical protein